MVPHCGRGVHATPSEGVASLPRSMPVLTARSPRRAVPRWPGERPLRAWQRRALEVLADHDGEKGNALLERELARS